MKKALITGITGQDGAYLAELLLKKGYEVHGIKRRASLFNTDRIDHLYQDPHESEQRFFLHYGDLTDATNLIRIIQLVQPDEIYNLAAQSHVQVSFESPEYTANADGLGTLRLLEAIRILGLQEKSKFYQASTSELYGLVQEVPQNEKTPFYPRSPYAVASSMPTGSRSITGKPITCLPVTGSFSTVSHPYGEKLLSPAKSQGPGPDKAGFPGLPLPRQPEQQADWGHAGDYVELQWLMLQQKKPKDYVIATGEQHSVKEFVSVSEKELGFEIGWKGKGVNEKGYDEGTGKLIVAVDPRYFRPTEVESLLGDANLAKKELGWEPKVSFQQMVVEMVALDLREAERDMLCRKGGFEVRNYFE